MTATSSSQHYFGRPKPEARGKANRQGRIRLGYETFSLPPGGTRVHFQAHKLDTGLLKDINGSPHVMVNIYSADKANNQNGLARCKTFFGIVSSAQAQTPAVACDIVRP